MAMLWGKLYRVKPDQQPIFHPLLAHLADVAAVFEALCDLPVICARLEAAMGCRLTPSLRSRLAVLAALHDLGKYSTGFQNKHDASLRPICGHIQATRELAYETLAKDAATLLGWLGDWCASSDSLAYLLNAAFSHHGRCVDLTDRKLHRPQCWNKSDFAAASELAELEGHLQKWFPDAFVPDATRLPEANLLQHFFAGLVILADWLGSDTSLFPYCGQLGRPAAQVDPMDFARRAAPSALEEVGLLTESFRLQHVPTFEEQFKVPAPYPLQRDMASLSRTEAGSLVVIESETGSGKTEAALRHFTNLFAQGLVDGLFFANPLRLAATQLHDRLVAFARNTWPEEHPAVVLAVPGYLQVDGFKGRSLPDYKVLWLDDSNNPLLTRRAWASEHPKRFCCAPLAVGTIDQALLAGLRVPHAHLRAVALSRSLLVIDEVHASDAYMTRLTLSIVDLFRRTGGHVLIMSATLGSDVRERYLQKHPLQNRPSNSTLEEAIGTPYPLISVKGDLPLTPKTTGRGKTVRIQTATCLQDPAAVASLAVEHAGGEGCVLILRNTVRQAVATLRELEQILGPDSPLLLSLNGIATLHHARFAGEDRKRLDALVTSLFGKRKRQTDQRPPCIVVSTQTLEQSLDVDFDLLITDLCPADVFLQRLGRLHRHQNPRPEHLKVPTCHVLVPEKRTPAFFLGREARKYGFGEKRAYENVLSLEATWRLLEEWEAAHRLLQIPEHNRHWVEHATKQAVLQDLARQLGVDWENFYGGRIATNAADTQQAGMFSISWGKPFEPGNVSLHDDQHAVTRLGINDLALALDEPVAGPFGEPVRLLRIPGHMLPGEPLPEEPHCEDLRVLPDGLTFGLAGTTFRYDRFGIQKEDT